MTTIGMIEAPFEEAADDRTQVRAAPAFATVEVHRGLESLGPLWSALLAEAIASPYQSFGFVKAWTDHVAPHEGVRPLAVIARDGSGHPVAILPLGVRRRLGVRVAGFVGGSHANYNVPILRRDRVARFKPSETTRLLREAARLGGVDVFALTNQPLEWQGIANPFAALPSQPSPDPAFSGPLAGDAEEHFRLTMSSKTRSKQRRKMRRFEEVGSTRIYRAATADERARLLEAYLAQKRQQLEGRGIADVFGRPGVRDFLAAGIGGASPAIDLYGFELDGDPIAVTGALPLGERYSCMFNSIQNSEHAKYSPGELLMNFVVEEAIRRGFKVFDLGVGVAPYKRTYCPNTDELFDSMLGVSPAGRAAAAAIAAFRQAKARVKANPTAYALVDRARKLKARKSEAVAGPEPRDG